MSCSWRLRCESTVSAYQKYCPSCVAKYGVAQDENWHKNHWFDDWDTQRLAEFQKDLQVAEHRAKRTV